MTRARELGGALLHRDSDEWVAPCRWAPAPAATRYYYHISGSSTQWSGTAPFVSWRHNGGVDFAFVDGHVA